VGYLIKGKNYQNKHMKTKNQKYIKIKVETFVEAMQLANRVYCNFDELPHSEQDEVDNLRCELQDAGEAAILSDDTLYKMIGDNLPYGTQEYNRLASKRFEMKFRRECN
jgi:hypothetical protein